MKCKHQFQGHADGVTCLLCGFRLTQNEYVKIMKSKNKDKKKSKINLERRDQNESL